ncbi:unnamed protein product [Brassica oleracea]
MLLRFTLAAKESDYFVVSKQLELEISLTLAAMESFQSLVYIIYLSNRSIIERLLSKPFYSNRRISLLLTFISSVFILFSFIKFQWKGQRR